MSVLELTFSDRCVADLIDLLQQLDDSGAVDPAGRPTRHHRFGVKLARLGDRVGRKEIYAVGFLARLGFSLLLHQYGPVANDCVSSFGGVGGAMVLQWTSAGVDALRATGARRVLGLSSTAFHLGYITGLLRRTSIDTIGWRCIFFANLPVALAAAFMAWKVLLRRQSSAPRIRWI